MDFMKNVYHTTIGDWGNIYPKLKNKKVLTLNVTKLMSPDEYKKYFDNMVPNGMYLISDTYIVVLWGKEKFYRLANEKRSTINKILSAIL
jgi:hypothetical protein